MKNKCEISHLRERWLRKPIESFDHKFGDPFTKLVYRNTGDYIDKKPIQEIKTNMYRICAKCGLIEVNSSWDGWHISFNQRADVEWRENGLNR